MSKSGVRIKTSTYPDEWYCSYHKCMSCGTEFMTSNDNFCPGCGEKIICVVHTSNMEDDK